MSADAFRALAKRAARRYPKSDRFARHFAYFKLTGDPAFRQGKVDFGGIRKTINLAFTPEAEVDKYVLVHVGFSISVIDEDEAKRVFEYLQQMDGLKEELGEIP